MAETVSDYLVRRLGDWGVERVFGYAGDGINGILGAIGRAGNTPRFVQVRHEETSALMACGHAKFTGEVGVCLATQGPGAIHTLNGLYDARLDHQPVVAIVGQQAQASMGGSHQQEVDLPTLFKDVAGAFVETVTDPAALRHQLDRAFRVAIAQRTVTCLIVPHDVQSQDAVPEPPRERGMQHSALGVSLPRIVPFEADLQRAAGILNAGQRVAMLIGSGARGAEAEITAVADALGAGVAKALLGKDVLPDDLPFVTGSAGWLGTSASNRMFERCDTLLMVGTSFPYPEFLPKDGQARGVQIDLDPGIVGLRYPVEAGLIGDSRETLAALLPLLRPKSDRTWRTEIEASVGEWNQESERRAAQPADPINPQKVFRELSERLPDRSIVVADSGSSAVWVARDVHLREGMRFSVSGTLATMGCGIPYAMAAKMAFPDRPAVACIGDGAMQMSGMTELITLAELWPEWSDPRLIVLVLNNRDLSYVTWEQRAMEGEPRFVPSQALPDVRYADYATLLGLDGIRVERPEDIGAAWDAALASSRPTVIDVLTDPNVPTIPPDPRQEVVAKIAAALESEPDADDLRRQIGLEGTTIPSDPKGAAKS